MWKGCHCLKHWSHFSLLAAHFLVERSLVSVPWWPVFRRKNCWLNFTATVGIGFVFLILTAAIYHLYRSRREDRNEKQNKQKNKKFQDDCMVAQNLSNSPIWAALSISQWPTSRRKFQCDQRTYQELWRARKQTRCWRACPHYESRWYTLVLSTIRLENYEMGTLNHQWLMME